MPSTSTKPNKVMRTCHSGHNMVVACWDSGKDGKKPYNKAKVVGATMFWLLCPNVAKLISRMESLGAIKEWSAKMEASTELQDRYAASHTEYEQWVQQNLPEETYAQFRKFHTEPKVRKYGNAGVNVPIAIKCLHAQSAMYLAGMHC